MLIKRDVVCTLILRRFACRDISQVMSGWYHRESKRCEINNIPKIVEVLSRIHEELVNLYKIEIDCDWGDENGAYIVADLVFELVICE